MGKRVEGARFPIFGDFGPFLRRFRSLEARTLAPAISYGHKNGYDSTAF
jgi:hypothetical protein